MSLKIGIIGLPNVGKSTLFNALLGKAQAAASSFPFCTIEPNVGKVPVPDQRLHTIAQLEGASVVTPTTVEFVDIAGLVKGAHQGQGLGNQFLSHIREVDAIIEVVRLFQDDSIAHITGNIHPQDDIETISTELLLADLQTLEKHLGKATKAMHEDPKTKLKAALYHRLKQHLEQGMTARSFAVDAEEQMLIDELQLLSAKPILYVANVDDKQLKDQDILKPLTAILGFDSAQAIAINAKAEAELTELEPHEQAEYLKELGLEEPGLNKIIQASYQLLDLITFFTLKPGEVQAWTVKSGTQAPGAAGTIHTDFEKGFIRAEVVSYNNLIAAGSMKKAVELGKVRQEGKDYIVKDGDVILFRFNV